MAKLSLPIISETSTPTPHPAPKVERRSGPARPSRQPDRAGKRPSWIKVRMSMRPTYFEVKKLVKDAGLHTVCESAGCPNIGECWSRRALTFMILGNVCTRSCGFCDVLTGRPGVVDDDEPRRVAEALATLNLRYAVITSVDRDDLPDGGARIWAETIRRVKEACPEMGLEVLTPDFKGDHDDIRTVVEARPDVFAHNIETVERLHTLVRPQARYARTLSVIEEGKKLGVVTKSGIMVGLGEQAHEVLVTMKDLRAAGCDIINIGQYLRPSDRHLPVDRWVTPEEFEWYAEQGRQLGFKHVESGPLVRSSYRADMQAEAMGLEHAWQMQADG
ncbi:MAG: lipoyl synthase [Myxococcota bacterium]